MSRSILILLASVLVLAVGCVSVKTPDVSVDVMDPVNAYKRHESSSKEPEPAPAPKLRYTPYASTLERVNRQQVRVTEEFTKRDWEDMEDEAQDWAADVRALNGYASVSHNPEKYRELASKLLDAVQKVKNAARAHDAAMGQHALDEADAILNQFSKTFPLTESADNPPPEPRPSRTTKAP
ncbi:MAG: hypothetical protein QUV05_14120 [Phycisphaerae bacterium]|nr:hypothetical protein [Phycisphaerae bacterium]